LLRASEESAMRQRSVSGTASRPWPVGTLRASAAVVLAALLSFAALAWLMMLRNSGADSMTADLGPGMGQTGEMGMGNGATASMPLPLFLGMWVTMMVAMMFPSVAPMVIIYSRFSSLRNQTNRATPVFVSGYLLAWTLVGFLAYGVYWGSSSLMATLSPRLAAVVGGGALVLAGGYQLTRYKTVCLRHCRTPMDFMLHWRSGSRGGLYMGVHHGLLCLGCCWGLMLVLLTVGVQVTLTAPVGEDGGHASDRPDARPGPMHGSAVSRMGGADRSFRRHPFASLRWRAAKTCAVEC
jgi:predicted metal-binding membrane protein